MVARASLRGKNDVSNAAEAPGPLDFAQVKQDAETLNNGIDHRVAATGAMHVEFVHFGLSS